MTSNVSNTELEKRRKLAILLEEAKSRGIDVSEITKKKPVYFHVDSNGYFVKQDGIQYNPNEIQKAFVDSTAVFTAFISGRGGGKALWVETEIPTTTGWKRIADLNVGDEVFDEFGYPCNVEWVSPIMCDHKCYAVEFDTGEIIIADAEHEWSVRTLGKLQKYGLWDYSKKSYDTVTTEDLYFRKLKTCSNYVYSVDVAKDIRYPHKDLLLHPYLLGVWLGDGSSREAKITIHDDDVDILNKLESLGYPVHEVSGLYSWSLSKYGGVNRKVQETLREIGVLNNKHIPKEYLEADYQQRLELLKGLMDTDGTVSKRGHCSFDSTNFGLAYDVYELVNSLRIKSTIREYYSRYNGNKVLYYKVAFTPHKSVFGLQRKVDRQRVDTVKSSTLRRNIVKVRPVTSVPVKCIRVDSQSKLFLATRSFIPTHNSASGAQRALHKIKEGMSGAVINPDF